MLNYETVRLDRLRRMDTGTYLVDPIQLGFVILTSLLILASVFMPLDILQSASTALGLAAIIFAGLPHGVLDIHIALNSSMGQSGASRFDILYLYVAIAIVGGIAWVMAPTYLVALFLALSIWHFSGDFRSLGRGLGLLIATSILLMPVVSYPVETQIIFAMLMSEAGAEGLVQGARWAWPLILVTMLGLIFRASRDPIIAGAGALAILAGFIFSPIIAFALYFAGLHSPLHIRAVLREMPVARPRLSEAALYAALTFGLLILMAGLWSRFGAEAPFTGAIFGLLIVLTLPHMAIVERWQRVDSF